MSHTKTHRRLLVATVLSAAITLSAWDGTSADEKSDLPAGHPRVSYENVKDIDAMAAALRQSLAKARTYSYSRAWWKWDRLRCRYVDHGRKDANALKVLNAVFQGALLDRYRALQARGEGDLLYIFFTTLRSGKREDVLVINGRKLLRDVHGGGYHGSWGGASRMRIYEELAKQGVLSQADKDLFKKIAQQSFHKHFIDFNKGHQGATNHAFGNAGGPAIALRLFPGGPQAAEARAWMDRVWKDLTGLGDWKEWTYYPYGPIFLHGLVDLAEERGAFKTHRSMLYAIGRRCLGFVHGGGVRGNPNSYAPATNTAERLAAIYRNPWQVGYYKVEQGARDGHFWYRMAKHFKNRQFLWAAVQVTLGGTPPDGKVPDEWQKAYDERFAVFNKMGIKPKCPIGKSSIGYISILKHMIPERLYLCPGRQSGKPFVSFFIYPERGSHLCSNAAGRLHEYCVDGAKLLGTAGKYNSGHIRQGGYDSLLVIDPKFKFPVNDKGVTDTNVDRGGKVIEKMLVAENKGDDSFGQFGFVDYFGEGSRWVRRTVLTAEGYLVVRDVYTAGKRVDGFQAGPCWLLRSDGDGKPPAHDPGRSWFDAPAWDHAWWQKNEKRVMVYIHPADGQTCGVAQHATSADISRTIKTNNSFAKAIVKTGEPKIFLSVLVPHGAGVAARDVVKTVTTNVDAKRGATAKIGKVTVRINADGSWEVKR